MNSIALSAVSLAMAVSLASACYRPMSSGTFMMQRAGDAEQLYTDPAFGIQRLEEDGVAILNARVSFGNETIGAPMVRGLAKLLREVLSTESVLHPSELASRINAAGLAPEYGDMLIAYATTGILERTTLVKLEQAVRVRYFGMPVLVSFREGQASRLSVLGVRIGKTASATARFDLQIWDGRTGRVIWEGSSDVTLAQEVVREEPIPLEEIIHAAWESLIREMPTNSLGTRAQE